MPGSVVKVANLLLVLHHVGWFASFLVLHGNVVLDCLKILPVLETRTAEISAARSKRTHAATSERVVPVLFYQTYQINP